MKGYEAKVSCHIFLSADSTEQLLDMITKWWAGIVNDTKVIEVIVFTANDDVINAEVFWCSLDKEQKEIIDKIVMTPQEILIDSQNISEN